VQIDIVVVMARLSCFTLMILVSPLLLTAAQSSQAGSATSAAAAGPLAAAGQAVCTLNIVGNGKKPGIKTAELSCKGGTITAAAHNLLLDFWGADKPTQGVVWVDNADGDCTVGDNILLTICGASNAVFIKPKVTQVWGDGRLSILVCVAGSQGAATVTVREGTFTGSSVTSLGLYTYGNKLHLDNCVISNNGNLPIDETTETAGAIVAAGGELLLQSSTISGNVAMGKESGAVSVWNSAHVTIEHSRFRDNQAMYGGALHVKQQGQVTIRGSSFEGNAAVAGGGGGAIYAWDYEASVIIEPSNRPGRSYCITPACMFSYPAAMCLQFMA
jgi:hypothetical protein